MNAKPKPEGQGWRRVYLRDLPLDVRMRAAEEACKWDGGNAKERAAILDVAVYPEDAWAWVRQ